MTINGPDALEASKLGVGKKTGKAMARPMRDQPRWTVAITQSVIRNLTASAQTKNRAKDLPRGL
jgi:hypothetical protein